MMTFSRDRAGMPRPGGLLANRSTIRNIGGWTGESQRSRGRGPGPAFSHLIGPDSQCTSVRRWPRSVWCGRGPGAGKRRRFLAPIRVAVGQPDVRAVDSQAADIVAEGVDQGQDRVTVFAGG